MTTPRLAKLPLRFAGWRFEGDLPRAKKCVVLAWPHTSNWDGLLLVALTQSIGLSMNWMIKNDWVRGPMGAILRRLGAVAIDRHKSNNIVQQMIAAFEKTDELVLVIPPEGTRKHTEYWKSGFYHIALGANVPVVPGYLDYARKVGGFGPPIMMTGNAREDMDKIRAYYETVKAEGKDPSKVSRIRLKEEDAEPVSTGGGSR